VMAQRLAIMRAALRGEGRPDDANPERSDRDREQQS